MPIYEYRCASCGFENEYLQKMSDAPLTDCPKCGNKSFNKLISAAGFQLKGSGWYVTDFKSNGAKPKASEKSEGSSDKATTESTDKSESADKSAKSESSCSSGPCPACQP